MIIPQFFIHSLVDRHSGCFCLDAIMNNAALNILFMDTHLCFSWENYLDRSVDIY